MILAICALMTFVTEFTSNIASTTIMIPILAALAQSVQVHPLLLIVPATLSASCAFMYAGGHPAQRHRLFERLDRYAADGSGGNRAECAGDFIGDGDVLRRALFYFGDRSGGFPRLGGEFSLWSLSACNAFD